MDSQQFCLKWDGFQGSVTSLFEQLRHDGELVDITLCCDGQRVRAHRMMLSACSPYFRQLIQENPCQQLVFFLKDTSAADLKAIIEFVYKGSVNVAQSQLASFIKTAETLQIRGLSGDEEAKAPAPPQPSLARSPASKRRRLSDHEPPPVPTTAPSPRPPVSPSHASPATPSPPVSSSCPLPPPLPPPAPLPHKTPTPAAPSTVPSSAHIPPLPPLPKGAEEKVVKVEKVDVLEDDVTSLDDTLGYVAEFEGTGYQGRAAFDQMAAMEHMAGAMPQAPGPSQRMSEDGSSQDNGRRRYACDVCGRTYQSPTALGDHKHKHTGLTVCPLCKRASSNIPNLRTHLRTVHGLNKEEIYRIIPPRQLDNQAAIAQAVAAGFGGNGSNRGATASRVNVGSDYSL